MAHLHLKPPVPNSYRLNIVRQASGVKELHGGLNYRPHEIEVKNVLRLKVFRKEAPSRPVSKCIRIIDKDMGLQILKRPDLNWVDVFRKAEELSKRFSSRSGSRSLDLLHVASCLLIPSRDFLTFDDRQATLAKKAGLHIVRLGK